MTIMGHSVPFIGLVPLIFLTHPLVSTKPDNHPFFLVILGNCT